MLKCTWEQIETNQKTPKILLFRAKRKKNKTKNLKKKKFSRLKILKKMNKNMKLMSLETKCICVIKFYEQIISNK